MSEADSIRILEEKITHMERHVGEQDMEIYRLTKQVEELARLVEKQRTHLQHLAGKSGEPFPLNEKPPHY